ncbi:TD and POZ domain-containing protein 3-like [Paramacrobiotus metropolitanus]|uniref:TD and POZ domain-containing protein 3-like n=1 Tax=Paramacrobiotus metropolitanus TaxID=2943436 RepID=UPI002445B76E|nr:TD and POZ domain-containing protein 3-like [Paramacrobiotus metropolitanus]
MREVDSLDPMAVPKPPTYKSSKVLPLKLCYKIPTDQFVPAGRTYDTCSNYVAEIRVEEEPGYPEIQACTWIVRLAVVDGGGSVRGMVYPKGDNQAIKSCTTVMVEWSARAFDDICDIRIGPTGWCQSLAQYNSLCTLAYVAPCFCGQTHYQLRKDGFVFVTLTFDIPSPAGSTSRQRLDLQYLWDSQLLADCRLLCQGREFPVHRAILAAQSPVFAAMFQSDMAEKATGVCRIEDTSAEVLDILLSFAYTRVAFEAGDETLMQLWHAADKYDMKELGAECERVMMGALTAENAYLFLGFAREHSLVKLKSVAAKFIGQHPTDI